jgi:hypothetical protein
LFDSAILKELLAHSSISDRDKLLICLVVNPTCARKVSEIKAIAFSAGLRKVNKLNVSSYLSKAKPHTVRTTEGWELTRAGRTHIASVVAPFSPSVSTILLPTLRKHLASISTINTRNFVDEAIKCLEAKLYRAAIITSWVGAVSVLYELVIKSNLQAFNGEATKRDPKWRPAKSADDLSRMKEFDFLQILLAISIIGKNVKDELEGCLKLRNGCGHPNSLIVGEHKATAHIETLIQNVFAIF